MKHFVFLESAGAPQALQQAALAAFGAAPFDVSVNLVHGDDAPWQVVLEAWIDAPALQRVLQAAMPPALVARRASYRVEELVEKDTGPDAGWPVAGVRLLVPWTRRDDVSPQECRRHWDEHVVLANRIHVGVTRYVRNWVEAIVDGDAPPYQGIASQHYASERDLRERSFDTPSSVQVIEDDVAEFIAEPVVLQVTEFRRTVRGAGA